MCMHACMRLCVYVVCHGVSLARPTPCAALRASILCVCIYVCVCIRECVCIHAYACVCVCVSCLRLLWAYSFSTPPSSSPRFTFYLLLEWKSAPQQSIIPNPSMLDIWTRQCVYILLFLHTYMLTTHTHTHIQHTYTHTPACTYMHTNIYILIHTHISHTHTYISHTHTYHSQSQF
jgi:hypothetical protein